jgi:hypothetical protein
MGYLYYSQNDPVYTTMELWGKHGYLVQRVGPGFTRQVYCGCSEKRLERRVTGANSCTYTCTHCGANLTPDRIAHCHRPYYRTYSSPHC